MNSELNIADLLRQFRDDTTTLVRDEVALAKNQLGDRLSLRSLMNSALDWWDSPASGNQANAATRRAFKAVALQVKQHPMPSLMIGGGLAWLIADHGDEEGQPAAGRRGAPSRVSDRSPKSDNGDAVGTLAHAKDAAAGAVDSARDKLSELGARTHRSADHLAHEAYVLGRSTVHKIKREVKADYHAAGESFGRAVGDYPLAMGMAFAALGTLAGLVLPRTRKEDEMMGDRSDDLVEAAMEKGSELLQSGKAVGGRVLESVADEAKEQGFTAGKVSGALASIADKGGAILRKAKDVAGQAADDEIFRPLDRQAEDKPPAPRGDLSSIH